MKKITALWVLLAVIGLAAPLFAQTSVNVSAAVGNRDSLVYDLYLQQDFNPWLDNQCWSLSPFVTGGLTLWDDSDSSDSVWGLMASFGLRLDYHGWDNVQPFVSLNGGPSYISQKTFVKRDFGGHFQFNSRAMVGVRFGDEFRHQLGAHATHYSNARTQSENDGFNYLGLAYGYAFN